MAALGNPIRPCECEYIFCCRSSEGGEGARGEGDDDDKKEEDATEKTEEVGMGEEIGVRPRTGAEGNGMVAVEEEARLWEEEEEEEENDDDDSGGGSPMTTKGGGSRREWEWGSHGVVGWCGTGGERGGGGRRWDAEKGVEVKEERLLSCIFLSPSKRFERRRWQTEWEEDRRGRK